MARREICRSFGVVSIFKFTVATMILSTAIALAPHAQAAMITVNSLADLGAPGICVLRDAITAANTMTAMNGCAAGTGDDTIGFTVTGTILLGSTLPQITATLLTVDGPISPGITISGGGSVQVMTVASGADVTLNHLEIIDGLGAIGSGSANQGGTQAGAIFNQGNLTITNSILSDNSANDGGAIYSEGNSLTILTVINSTFSHNIAFSGGGAIANASQGAITASGTVNVIDSTFSNNSATRVNGGGIENGNYGTVTVTDSTFTGNSASSGGAINNEGLATTLTVTGTTFSGNSAVDIFGGGISQAGPATVANCTFTGNFARVGGGGISNGSQPLIVTNSTFSGNSSSSGGGIWNPGGPTMIKNSILTDSTGNNCWGSINDVGYNISNDTSCGFAPTGSAHNGDSVDPMLSTSGLANNDGPTQTIALLDGSPAIDSIPLANCSDQSSPPNPVVTDQRLFPRPGIGETDCSIGAYEFQNASFSPFANFLGNLTITAETDAFNLNGGFKLAPDGSIDPTTQAVAFSAAGYAFRLPAGSFLPTSTGYVYQKTINGTFLYVRIDLTSTPGKYRLLVNRTGGTLTAIGNPVLVTLTIGDDAGSIQMNATIN